ncbi:MAG: serine hydrolase [Candidatus Heimdallarchaeota archaeon]|nr:serine hydrolase [Candidatus Heimdallarchaeota archaeon]
MFDLSDFKDKLEPRITKKMTQNSLPGMAITLSQDGETVYSQGFGSRNLEKYLPYTPDTLNGFGSCTKSLTCLAIMMLASDDKLSVHDPVSNYIDFRLGTNDDPITIHHLMSHSSGIPNLGSAELTIGPSIPFELNFPSIPFAGKNDFYNMINQAGGEIFFNPGDHFHYFNSGYTMLQFIIENVSGMDYIDFIRKNILDPLEMKRSGFREGHVNTDANWSVPYTMLPNSNGKLVATVSRFPFSEFLLGPGGLISSTNEMMNYVNMMSSGGKFKDELIFDSKMLETMYEFHYAGRMHPTLSSFGESGYGYGWGITRNFLGNDIILHGGGITGGASLIGFLKDSNIGFTAIGNADGFPVMEVFSALTLLLGKDPEKELPFVIKQNHYARLCGEYKSYNGIYNYKVTNKGGVLHVETGPPPTSIPIIPATDDNGPMEFYYITPFGINMPITFRFDEKDKAHFIVERNSLHKIN